MKYKTKLINGEEVEKDTYKEILELIKKSGYFHRYPITRVNKI